MIKLYNTRADQKITLVRKNVHSITPQNNNSGNIKKLLLPTVLMLSSLTGCASQSFQFNPFKPSQPTIAPPVVHQPAKEEKPKEKDPLLELENPFGEPNPEDFKPRYQDLKKLGIDTSQPGGFPEDKSQLNLQNNNSQYNQPKTEALPLPKSVYDTPPQTNAEPLKRPVWSPVPDGEEPIYSPQYGYINTPVQTKPQQKPEWSPIGEGGYQKYYPQQSDVQNPQDPPTITKVSQEYSEDGQESAWRGRTNMEKATANVFFSDTENKRIRTVVSKPAITTEALRNEKEYRELITLFNKQIDINVREYLSNLKLKNVIEKQDDKNKDAENLLKTLQEITAKTQNLLNKYCENETTKKQILNSLKRYTTAVEQLYLNNIPEFIRNAKIQKSSNSSKNILVLEANDANTYELKKKELLTLRKTFASTFNQMEKSLGSTSSENSDTSKPAS